MNKAAGQWRTTVLPGAALLGCLVVFGAAAFRPKEVEIARYASSLIGRTPGQRHNATLALERLSGAVIEPGETFSFNARVGSFSRDMGYRKAPVSYNGQLIDSWGGGVCQTSTTLYNAALLAGLEIVERNRHRFAPSYVPPGLDAAVAFNSIDLKFRNPHQFPLRIAGSVQEGRLEIAILGAEALSMKPAVVTEVSNTRQPGLVTIGKGGSHGRLRNSGKAGCDVAVYRITGERKELISRDEYPAMFRIVQASD